MPFFCRQFFRECCFDIFFRQTYFSRFFCIYNFIFINVKKIIEQTKPTLTTTSSATWTRALQRSFWKSLYFQIILDPHSFFHKQISIKGQIITSWTWCRNIFHRWHRSLVHLLTHPPRNKQHGRSNQTKWSRKNLSPKKLHWKKFVSQKIGLQKLRPRKYGHRKNLYPQKHDRNPLS